MTRLIAGAAWMAFACFPANGQTADSLPAFEVASVKLAPPEAPGHHSAHSSGGPGTPSPGQWTCSNYNLPELMILAYGIERNRLSGPSWMETQGFDIVAKVPAGTTREQFRLMLQDLLARRLKLAAHHEQKELPLYELAIAKNGPKLRESAARLDTTAATPRPGEPRKELVDKNGYPVPSPGEGIRSSGRNERMRMDATGGSMDDFVKVLGRHAGRPVVNATGLKGKYDFILYWVREDLSAAAPGGPGGAVATLDSASGPTLFHALQDQLGLKLEPKKGPVDFLVIDHVERVPVEN